MEDWTEAHDILCCNLNFYQHEWYNCVIINDDTPGTSVACLHSLLQCWLPSGKVVDIVLVHAFTRNSWKLYTMWKNCQILAEARNSSFVLLDYVIWGALLCPIYDFDARLHYVIDTVNGDMFLHVNNLLWCDNIVVNGCQIPVSSENDMISAPQIWYPSSPEVGQDLSEVPEMMWGDNFLMCLPGRNLSQTDCSYKQFTSGDMIWQQAEMATCKKVISSNIFISCHNDWFANFNFSDITCGWKAMVQLHSGDLRKQVMEHLVGARLKLLVWSQWHYVPPFLDVGQPLNEVNAWYKQGTSSANCQALNLYLQHRPQLMDSNLINSQTWCIQSIPY